MRSIFFTILFLATYSTTPLSPPKTTPNLINTPAANPIPNLSSSIPSRLASHHSPPPPIPTSIIINNVPSSSALPIISASVASAAASAAYRSNPMSFSSMVSDHGREELVGAYPAVNNAVTPLGLPYSLAFPLALTLGPGILLP